MQLLGPQQLAQCSVLPDGQAGACLPHGCCMDAVIFVLPAHAHCGPEPRHWLPLRSRLAVERLPASEPLNSCRHCPCSSKWPGYEHVRCHRHSEQQSPVRHSAHRRRHTQAQGRVRVRMRVRVRLLTQDCAQVWEQRPGQEQDSLLATAMVLLSSLQAAADQGAAHTLAFPLQPSGPADGPPPEQPASLLVQVSWAAAAQALSAAQGSAQAGAQTSPAGSLAAGAQSPQRPAPSLQSEAPAPAEVGRVPAQPGAIADDPQQAAHAGWPTQPHQEAACAEPQRSPEQAAGPTPDTQMETQHSDGSGAGDPQQPQQRQLHQQRLVGPDRLTPAQHAPGVAWAQAHSPREPPAGFRWAPRCALCPASCRRCGLRALESPDRDAGFRSHSWCIHTALAQPALACQQEAPSSVWLALLHVRSSTLRTLHDEPAGTQGPADAADGAGGVAVPGAGRALAGSSGGAHRVQVRSAAQRSALSTHTGAAYAPASKGGVCQPAASV